MAKTTAEIFADYQAAFNILGRLSVLKTTRKKTGKILPLMSSSHLFADVPADLPEDVSTIYTSFDLPPTNAVEFIRSLTPVTREIFDGLSRQYQVDAITITGVTDLRLIDKIRDELADVVMSGATKDAFRSAVDDLTDAAGVARLTSPTIDTVFSANAQKAYSTGRYEQMTEQAVLDVLPFWQYWSVGDDRVRPEHEALDGFVARALDRVWMKIYPPSGFGCRCSVTPITEKEALMIDKDASEDGMLRLPKLVVELVPQPGYTSILAA
jgi:SPP1 gp7 family putative phage head morphogenesis protein